MTVDTEEKRKLKKKLRISRIELILLIALALIPLFVANAVIFSDQKMETSLGFQDGSQIPIFDDTLVLNNDYASDQSSHIFSIYALNNMPGIELEVTDLTERDSGTKIPSTDVTLRNISLPNTITPENPRTIGVSVDYDLKPGLYQGTLFASDGTTIAAVPINLDVKPPLAKPVIIVVDGIALSIGLWKFIAYLNSLYSEIEVTRLMGRLDARVLRYKEMKEKPAAYATKKPVVIKNGILDAGTIFFGIALGLIALPTTEAIINLHTIGSFEVLTLIGIGLGIGSLKEFISRA